MKPGGNYTQPVYDPVTETVTYEVYVGWSLIALVDNDAEASFRLHSALLEKAAGTEIIELTPA